MLKQRREKTVLKPLRLARRVLLVSIAFLVVVSPFFIFSAHAEEPFLTTILSDLGFTNINLTDVETFSAGTYNITLYAEFAGYHEENELSYYELDDPDVFNVIFSGPDGGFGYIDPPLNRSFTADYQFGLSMLSKYSRRYFTNTSRNGDGQQHAVVYENLNAPGMYLIGFENQWGGGDRDYNDMVFSIKPYTPTVEYYLTVETDPASIVTIPGEGWYDNCTQVNLTAPTFVSGSPGVQYLFDCWDVDGSSQGSGVNPITVHMNANHTATAHYITQYFLTVVSPYGTPGGEGWYNSSTLAYASLDTGIVDHGNDTRRVFMNWSGDASGTNYAQSDAIHMDGPKTATAMWKTQYNVTFAQTGLDATASSTVVTVNGAPKNFSDLPFSMWADNGSSVTYEYSALVSSTVPGKRFRLDSISGPSSPFTVTGPVTITGNYKTQYELTVHTNGLDTYSTDVYNNTDVLGTATDATPYSDWFDKDSSLQLNIDSPITDGSMRFVFTQWSGDATGTTRPLPVVMNSAKDITANYKTQYQVCFDQTGVGTDFTGTIVTIDTTGYDVTDLPVCFWWDKDSGHSFSFASPLVVDAGKQYVWVSTSGLSTLQSDTLTITSSGSVTGNYSVLLKYEITFDQTGVSSDFTGTVVVIDGTDYGVDDLPVSFLWEGGSIHGFAFQSPLIVTPNAKRYLWTSTTGLSSLKSGSITVSAAGSIIGNYKTQYYLTVTSPYDSPTPTSGWFDAGSSVTASVTSPWPGPAGVRYVCTGWTGTGSVPASGTGTSVTFPINEPSSITWTWKTQYYLTVRTDPSGLSPAPTPSSKWYDNSTNVDLTAPDQSYLDTVEYNFTHWDVDGPTVSGNPILVHMDMPHTATAHYETKLPPPPPCVGGEMILIKVDKPVVGPSGVELAAALLAAVAAVAVLVKWRRKI